MSSELLEESNSRFLMEAKEAIGFFLLELEYMDVPTHLHEPSSHSGDQWQTEPGPTVLPYCVIYSLPWLQAPLSLVSPSLVLLLGAICKDIQALCLSTVKPSYPSCISRGSPLSMLCKDKFTSQKLVLRRHLGWALRSSEWDGVGGRGESAKLSKWRLSFVSSRGHGDSGRGGSWYPGCYCFREEGPPCPKVATEIPGCLWQTCLI